MFHDSQITSREARAQLRGVVCAYNSDQFDAEVQARHGVDVAADVRRVRQGSDVLDQLAALTATEALDGGGERP